MKLIEALKQIKNLERKAEDLLQKVKVNCAISSLDTPLYPDQKKQISQWMQAYSDILKEILRLRIAIQKTNLETSVVIEFGTGVTVKKSIAEWIHRRRDLAKDESKIWSVLSDRGIQEGLVKSPGGQEMELKIVRYYDPEERDKMRELFDSEPMLIDSRLEVVNAITDLIE
jgi:hypothetical protein